MTETDQDPGVARVWLSTEEVQQITGASKTEIYEALWAGDLEGHQRSKRKKWRIHRDAVDRWITGPAGLKSA